MYPRSPEFDQAYVDNHKMVIKAAIYSTTGTLEAELDVLDGTVTVDDVPVRRTADIDLGTYELLPEDAADLLAPRRNEVRLYRGIEFVDGTQELLPVGVFMVRSNHIDDSGDGLHISCTLSDRAYRVARDKFTVDQSFTGASYSSTIQAIVFPSVPWMSENITPVSATVPLTVAEAGDDRWKLAQQLAHNIGYELYFDQAGTLTLQPVPDYDEVDPVWNFVEGDGCTVLYINRRQTEEDSYNHVVVVAENAEAGPVRGEAFDNNPASDTYVLGPYGRVVNVIRSSSVQTVAQANSMAFGEFQRSVGTSDFVRFNAIPHPAFEIGDVVTIAREASGITGRYIIDKISLPLTYKRPMDISMRRRRL